MKRLRIGVDINGLLNPDTGIGNYTYNLLKALLEMDKENSYILFFNSRRVPRGIFGYEFLRRDNVTVKRLSLPHRVLEFAWQRLRLLRVEDLMGDMDVFHASDWLLPPAKKTKIVTTIHDMAYFVYPDFYTRKIIKTRLMHDRTSVLKSDAIIAISNNTKDDIMRFLNAPEKKVRVIHYGGPRTELDCNEELDAETFKGLSERYGIKKPYIMFLGSQEPRKNLPRLLEAYESCKNGDIHKRYQLLIVGGRAWLDSGIRGKIDDLKLKDRVIVIEHVNKKEARALLKTAELLAYVTLYEGFGLPPLEAMACGTPVLTSRTSSIPEVVGDAAIMVDPTNVGEISNGLCRILTDEKLRAMLTDKGKRRAESFCWNKCAKETLELYREVASR